MAKPDEPPVYKSAERLALAIQIFIGAVIFLVVTRMIFYFAVTHMDAQAIESLMSSVGRIPGLLQPIPNFAAGICFLIWSRRCFRNLRSFNVEGLQNKEWYYLWGFFIPVACFFIPMSVTNEIWKASNPGLLDSVSWKSQKDSMLVVAWWVGWLAYGILHLIRRMSETVTWQVAGGFFDTALGFYLPQVIYCVAGILAIMVVREITDRQVKKHQALASRSG